jgi:hypothetical protein
MVPPLFIRIQSGPPSHRSSGLAVPVEHSYDLLKAIEKDVLALQVSKTLTHLIQRKGAKSDTSDTRGKQRASENIQFPSELDACG